MPLFDDILVSQDESTAVNDKDLFSGFIDKKTIVKEAKSLGIETRNKNAAELQKEIIQKQSLDTNKGGQFFEDVVKQTEDVQSSNIDTGVLDAVQLPGTEGGTGLGIPPIGSVMDTTQNTPIMQFGEQQPQPLVVPSPQGIVQPEERGFEEDPALSQEIDAELKSGLDDIARRKGIFALIQGLGQAAAGAFGLTKGIDMSGVSSAFQPDFTTDEKVILDKAKFKRAQLIEERRLGERKEQRRANREFQAGTIAAQQAFSGKMAEFNAQSRKQLQAAELQGKKELAKLSHTAKLAAKMLDRKAKAELDSKGEVSLNTMAGIEDRNRTRHQAAVAAAAKTGDVDQQEAVLSALQKDLQEFNKGNKAVERWVKSNMPEDVGGFFAKDLNEMFASMPAGVKWSKYDVPSGGTKFTTTEPATPPAARPQSQFTIMRDPSSGKRYKIDNATKKNLGEVQ